MFRKVVLVFYLSNFYFWRTFIFFFLEAYLGNHFVLLKYIFLWKNLFFHIALGKKIRVYSTPFDTSTILACFRKNFKYVNCWIPIREAEWHLQPRAESLNNKDKPIKQEWHLKGDQNINFSKIWKNVKIPKTILRWAIQNINQKYKIIDCSGEKKYKNA